MKIDFNGDTYKAIHDDETLLQITVVQITEGQWQSWYFLRIEVEQGVQVSEIAPGYFRTKAEACAIAKTYCRACEADCVPQ